MSEDHFQYDQLMLNAHRGLIRQVLSKVEQTGLPGEHHFFIVFKTTHPGTNISNRLRAQYPSEMTIVLQHQYSNLKVYDDRFEIQLSFNRIPELLVIPFKAITGFVDPSVPFGLQLASDAEADLDNNMGMMVPDLSQAGENIHPDEYLLEDENTLIDESRTGGAPATPPLPNHLEPVDEFWESDETSISSLFSSKDGSRGIKGKGPFRLVEDEDESESKKTEKSVETEPAEASPAKANIVQLDAFRKKSK